MFNLWHSYLQLARTGWDANAVVALRIMRIASGGTIAQREIQRMIIEKGFAMAQAQAVAAAKMMTGGSAAAASASASRVFHRKVRANKRRLSRR
jgi:hypothetical protein